MILPDREGCYRTSRCARCMRHRGQNLLSSSRSGSFRRFFDVAYVRSLHSVQASVMICRSPFFAMSSLLPVSLAYGPVLAWNGPPRRMSGGPDRSVNFYSRIFVTAPAPTVRPPSRIAKRRPSSTATGVCSSTVILTLSPGITISTPSGSAMVPVTSVVRM
jgi:hypothetical protein